MQVHAPVEKNHKHKTDSMSWKDVPWQSCDLNFRPPSWSKLSKSTGAAYGELLVAAIVAVIAFLIFQVCVLPGMLGTSWLTMLLIAGIVSSLVSSGWYRPLPRVFGEQNTTSTGVACAFGLVGFFAVACISAQQSSFDLAVMLLFAVSLPVCLYLADQLTGHMLHWWSADPAVSRSSMVLWRNAWHGRFITTHVDELSSVGIQAKYLGKLKRYWLSHVLVIVVYAVSMLAAIVVADSFRIVGMGAVFGISSTVLLLAAATWADWLSLSNRPNTACILGHWFLYLKDTTQPPWVMPSPAGNQVVRVFLSYAAVSLFAIAFLLLALATNDLSPTETTGSLSMILTMAAVAVLLAPLHVLAICFVVAAPTLSQVEMGLVHDHCLRGTK